VLVRADLSGASGVGDLSGADLTDAKGRSSAQVLRWLLLFGGAALVLIIALSLVWRSKGIARDDTLADLTGDMWTAAGGPQTGPPPPGPGPAPPPAAPAAPAAPASAAPPASTGNMWPPAGGPQTGPPPPGPG
jgi:hypothetical protein